MILVTGGAGFIGSVLAKELNNRGHDDLIIVDRIENPSENLNLKSLKYYAYIDASELFNEVNLSKLENLTAIFHMGACSSTTEMDIDFLRKNNIEYSQHIFELALKNKVPLVYASSAATYGDGEHGYSDDESEISKLKPLNPYGNSKQLFDLWVLEQSDRPKHWYGVKFFNVYGPNEYHKADMRSLVHKGFQQIDKTGKVKLFKSHKEGYDDGGQLRDFVYVKDVVNACIEMSKGKGISGIYNLGTGKAQSFKELISALFEARNLEVNIEYIDMPENLRGQYQYFTQADMSKFHKNFPDFNFSSVEKGVADYVQCYLEKNNPWF